jgi:hypothetical protein
MVVRTPGAIGYEAKGRGRRGGMKSTRQSATPIHYRPQDYAWLKGIARTVLEVAKHSAEGEKVKATFDSNDNEEIANLLVPRIKVGDLPDSLREQWREGAFNAKGEANPIVKSYVKDMVGQLKEEGTHIGRGHVIGAGSANGLGGDEFTAAHLREPPLSHAEEMGKQMAHHLMEHHGGKFMREFGAGYSGKVAPPPPPPQKERTLGEKIKNEFINELIAQYVITGEIKFNKDYPQILATSYTWGHPQGDYKKHLPQDEMEDLIHYVSNKENDIRYYIQELISNAVGEIYVM